MKQLLRVELPEAGAAKYSFHSFRVRFASSLLAAGCPPATIQALARWSSAESFAIYARLNPPEYAGWVSKALLQRTDSISTRNLPRLPLIDDFDFFATFSTAS
jgi:integrase